MSGELPKEAYSAEEWDIAVACDVGLRDAINASDTVSEINIDPGAIISTLLGQDTSYRGSLLFIAATHETTAKKAAEELFYVDENCDAVGCCVGVATIEQPIIEVYAGISGRNNNNDTSQDKLALWSPKKVQKIAIHELSHAANFWNVDLDTANLRFHNKNKIELVMFAASALATAIYGSLLLTRERTKVIKSLASGIGVAAGLGASIAYGEKQFAKYSDNLPSEKKALAAEEAASHYPQIISFK